MADITIEQAILEQVRKLDTDQQNRVLEFALNLSRPKGEPGWMLIQHAQEINFPHEDLEEMKRAIEEEFEQIDDDDWDKQIFSS